MEFSEEELRHVEKLSRLEISDESRDKLKKQLAEIIEFVNKLKSIDVEGLSSKYSVTMEKQYLRHDEPDETLSRDDVLASAPESSDGFFKVPPVIEGEEL